MESLKDVVESCLQADKSLVTRQTLHCKKNTTNGGNALKQDVESLIMPLQAACYAFSSEMLDEKL